MSKSIKILFFILSVSCLQFLGSCKKGCTDKKAENYDETARREDNSQCKYASVNSIDADKKSTSELVFFVKKSTALKYGIEVYVNDNYIGLIEQQCQMDISCTAECDKVIQGGLEQGSHSYYANLVKANADGNEFQEKIEEGNIFVAEGECKTITINN